MADTANDSSVKSYVDSATGAVQSAIGSVTGNTSDQVCKFFLSTLFKSTTAIDTVLSTLSYPSLNLVHAPADTNSPRPPAKPKKIKQPQKRLSPSKSHHPLPSPP